MEKGKGESQFLYINCLMVIEGERRKEGGRLNTEKRKGKGGRRTDYIKGIVYSVFSNFQKVGEGEEDRAAGRREGG